MINLYNGDCLQVMDELIQKGVKVDCIITDPPYGTTACKWDTVIDFQEMWKRLNLIIKDNGAIVLFGSQPFTSALVMSNPKMFRFEVIWEKSKKNGFIMANNRPLKKHENIIIFSKAPANKNPTNIVMKYNPQGLIELEKTKEKNNSIKRNKTTFSGRFFKNDTYIQKYTNYPDSIILFDNENGLHPTQKPVALLEYLVKTYTNENDVVLDFTMGSGSTGVACKNLNRKFIGIELDENYFKIAKERIEK